MKNSKTKRFLACLLAAMLLSQTAVLSPAVFADGTEDGEQVTEATPVFKEDTGTVDVIIESNTNTKDALSKALLENYSDLTNDQIAKLDWQYECTGYKALDLKKENGKTAWGSVDGFTNSYKEGLFNVNFHFAALNKQDAGLEFQVKLGDVVRTIKKVDAYSSTVVLNDSIPAVKIPYNEDMSIDFDTLYQSVFDAVVNASASTPNLTRDDVTITYKPKVAWCTLEGKVADFSIISTEFDPIKEGTFPVKVEFNGNDTYAKSDATCEVEFLGREAAPFQVLVPEGPIDLVFANAADLDYTAIEQSIREALVVSTDENYSINDITVKYKVSTGNYQPISYVPKVFDAFGEGTFDIQLTWKGNSQYKDFEQVIKNVEFKDNRLASSIVYNDNASITYNMEASVMEETIIKNALNLDASELPEGVSVSDFTIEYYSKIKIGVGEASFEATDWVPIEGKQSTIKNIFTGEDVTFGYPQMGAGEQQIRVAFNGNAQYKPCAAVEGTLTVNKADVKVSVKNKIMHVKDELPEDFVTLNPNDPAIDIYTVYAGITSNVTTSVYVQLPARYQIDENVMKVVDFAVEKITGRSFSEILQEGITVGELKEFVNKLAENAEALEPILNAFNIDISSFIKFVEIVTKLPSIADNMRIAFGTPNHAGVYSVFAVTNNPNYNTAVGIGSITLLMQTKDMKINLNEGLARTITVSQAKALAESGAVATLNHSGSADGIDQTALHYLYSGVQKNLKPYSSTKNFPTEPGRYVVTVVVLGGDYLAAPVTYSFKIVND